jgi:hypothetical protein
MKFISAFLLTLLISSASFAKDPVNFSGFWITGSVKDDGPGLLLYPDGKAYLNAMCGSASGTWTTTDSNSQISVELQEGPSELVKSYIFELNEKNMLVEKKLATVSQDPEIDPSTGSTPEEIEILEYVKNIKAEAAMPWVLEKSNLELPKINAPN